MLLLIMKLYTSLQGRAMAVLQCMTMVLRPRLTDYLITKSSYTAHNPEGNLGNYFTSQYQQGYNVGLGVQPTNKSGTVNYVNGSVGFLFRPCLNYFLSDWCALNIGGYFMFQPFNNSVPSGYMLTDKVGTYNSLLNSVSSGNDISYGGNLGVRFFFGNDRTPMTVSYVDQSDPTACGACDGTVTMYGLPG